MSKSKSSSEKKMKRMENKKRKIQAYLELITESRKSAKDGSAIDCLPNPEDVDVEDILNDPDCKDGEIIALRRKVKKELLKVKPRIVLKDVGINARINLDTNGDVIAVHGTENGGGDTDGRVLVPITFLEAQILMISCLLPPPKRLYQPICAEVQRVTRAANVNIFLINNDDNWFKLDKDEQIHFQSVLKFDVNDEFNTFLNMKSEENYSWTQKMLMVPIGHTTVNSEAFNGTKNGQGHDKDDDGEDLKAESRKISTKLNLMLTQEQMKSEGFPQLVDKDLPTNETSIEESSKNETSTNEIAKEEAPKDVKLPVRKIKPTLKEYLAPTEDSKLFSLDCEMCLTDANVLEVTRVSMINEDEEVVYESLVKPKNKIINYLTEYSGINCEMLTNVSTKLKHVRRSIRDILPPDAILIGHSLNNDLTCLGLYHPHVIDTSVIYNLSGFRSQKSKLKTLSEVFLGQKIQESRDLDIKTGDNQTGHDSVEDAKAALRLVKLKLGKELNFGDNVRCERRVKWSKSERFVPILDFFKSKNENVNVFFDRVPDPLDGINDKDADRCINVFSDAVPSHKIKEIIFKSLSKSNRSINIVLTSNGLCYISCH